jgi:hypothetical protein
MVTSVLQATLSESSSALCALSKDRTQLKIIYPYSKCF